MTTQGKMSIRKKGSKGMDTGITYPAMQWRDKSGMMDKKAMTSIPFHQ